MKASRLPKKERSLLAYAVSKLRPGVFSHPVWVRFGDKDKAIPPETIQNLLREAEQLELDSPCDACQVLLICAVYQNYSGQRSIALRTLQKALNLAERSGLSQEILWALWGACAVSIQEGNYAQAADHFRHLQDVLNGQNEWMLADYVDVVRQYFLFSATMRTEKYSTAPGGQNSRSLLTLTLEWLSRWGFSAQSDLDVSFDHPPSRAPSLDPISRSLLPVQRPREPWHTLRLIFSGELKLHWGKSDFPRTKSQTSFWASILSSLRVHIYGQKNNAATIDAEPQTLDYSPSQRSIEAFAPSISAPRQMAQSENKPPKINHLRAETTVVPVSVHMLGRFEMSIQDTVPKLPASRSLSLLQYLMLNHKRSTPREVLMDVFWPDAASEAARNNLNVAIYGIRRVLRSVIDLPVIFYKDGAYSIAPNMQVWLDIEEFQRLVKAGQQTEARDPLAAVSEYEAAVSIYQGDFLEENPFEGWTALTRESLRMAYLNTLDSLSHIYFNQDHYAACINTCQLILARDRCREDAHCMLMQCYQHQGQDHLALRQYHICREALRLELDVAPAPATTQLFQQIRQHRRV